MRSPRVTRIAIGAVTAGLMFTGVAATAQAAPMPTKKIPATTVAMHNTASDCWSIVGKGVYNLTSYVNKHPGGSAVITKICGKNGTSAFKGEHSGESKPAKVLKAYKIGTVK